MKIKNVAFALPLIALTSVIQAQGNPHQDVVSKLVIEAVTAGNPHDGAWTVSAATVQAGNPHIGFEQLPFRVESARK